MQISFKNRFSIFSSMALQPIFCWQGFVNAAFLQGADVSTTHKPNP